MVLEMIVVCATSIELMNELWTRFVDHFNVEHDEND